MEPAFVTPAPPHATVEIRAATAAGGPTIAPRAIAPPSSAPARAASTRTPADAAPPTSPVIEPDPPTPTSPHAAAEIRAAAAARGPAAAATDSAEDVEEVKDPKGILGPTTGRYNQALLQRAGSPMRAKPGWAERPPPDGYTRVAGAVILREHRRASDVDPETLPPADDQADVEDPRWVDQALREMEEELDEYEEHINRPTSHGPGKLFSRRQRQKQAKWSQNYGDPFASHTVAHEFADSDGSESDEQDFDDERIHYAQHPSQSRKNADASSAFFRAHHQQPSSSRQPLPNPPIPPTHQAPWAPPPPPPPWTSYAPPPFRSWWTTARR